MNILIKFCFVFIFFSTQVVSQTNDHEKAIEAVQSGEILPLDQILQSIKQKFNGRVLAINLNDNEQGLFGWVYDIRMIDRQNNVINLRIDAGTSTVLMVEEGR